MYIQEYTFRDNINAYWREACGHYSNTPTDYMKLRQKWKVKSGQVEAKIWCVHSLISELFV